MPVKIFTDGLEPDNPQAVICRFLTFKKFADLIQTGELYFNRSDLFPQDEKEGLPPEEYQRILGLHPLDIRDRRELNHSIASTAQFREGFFISCWYLFDEEHANIWRLYGQDGVAVFSRYDLLKTALDSLADEAFLGLVRYGSRHLTGWNIMRFITTKREEYADDREVRALLWIRDEFAGINRHFDGNNWPHERPLTPPPPDRVKDFHHRIVDLHSLITDVVVSPFAPDGTLAKVTTLLDEKALSIPSRVSELARYSRFLP